MGIHEVVKLLEQAGKKIILPALDNLSPVQTKDDGSVVTEADVACQDFICEQLHHLDDSIGFLSEEMSDDEQQQCLQGGGTYWCLDPLDGTTNFATSLPAFAISLALIETGRPVMAAIHDPVRRESFYARADEGAWLNDTPISASPESKLKNAVGFIDFKRLDVPLAIRLATEQPYRSQRNIGTCALEWAWLAAGRAQFIVHGGQKIWDFSAGGLLAQEAGCIASDMGGAALFPGMKPVRSIAAAANTEIHGQLLKLLAID